MKINVRVRAYTALLICLALCLFTLSGCSYGADIVRVGIDIEEGTHQPITQQTRKRAISVISAIAELYTEGGSAPSLSDISQAAADEISGTAEECGLSDLEYDRLLDTLEDEGEELAAAMRAIKAKRADSSTVSVLANIYFKISGIVKADVTGALAYSLCIMDYDRRIEGYLLASSAAGNVMAAELSAKKNIIVNDIGREGFSELLRLGFFFRAFLTDGGIDPDALADFSDSELLIFLKRIKPSGLDIGKEGYKLIADYYADSLFGTQTGCLDELLYELCRSADIDAVAQSLTRLPALISSVLEGLDASDVALMREGRQGALAFSVFSSFEDGEWMLFEEITAISLTSGNYEIIAEDFFGEAFLSYKAVTSARTLAEVRSASTEDDFLAALDGYMYGISPAFSYTLIREGEGQ